jgi:hypothetical protein
MDIAFQAERGGAPDKSRRVRTSLEFLPPFRLIRGIRFAGL